MPYSIIQDRPDCAGYAVVKDDDMELMGCHRTRSQAEAQLAALNIAETDDNDNDEPTPGDDDENLANQAGIRSNTPNIDAVNKMLASLKDWRLN
jgi:hypothetical protein